MKLKKENFEEHRWLKSIKSLTPSILLISSFPKNKVYIENMLSLVLKLLKNKGEKRTIDLLKNYRLTLNQFLLKQEVSSIPFHKKRGSLPLVLKPWQQLALGDNHSKRTLLSLWRVIDSFRCKPSTNTDSIESEFTGNNNVITEILDWTLSWNYLDKIRDIPLSGRVLLSNKAGPNGLATLSAYKDISALRDDIKLYKSVESLYNISHPFGLTKYEGKSGEFKHSKIVFISDKACKTRIIAIGDYWSNMSLQPIHDKVMLGLKGMKSDLTYRQSSLPALIKEAGNNLYSSDCTAFTDRLPTKLVAGVVAAIQDEKYGDLWKEVVTNRVFKTPKGEIKYSVGNPMGFLSSWALSTLTHHIIKEWCAYKCRAKNYKYFVLGDDCLDTNKDVYTKYIHTMKELGMTINTSKCTVSEQGYAEFAKRLISPTGELTGIPVDLLVGIQSQPQQFIELVRIMRERGYSEEAVKPGVLALINKHPKRKLIRLVLSAPESLLGTPPLEGNAYANQFYLGSEELFSKAIESARTILFWREVDLLVKQFQKGKSLILTQEIGEETIENDHPAIWSIVDKSLPYTKEDSLYSIWDGWMSGTDYSLVFLPSIKKYERKNRGQLHTKTKFKVIKLVIQILKRKTLPLSSVPKEKLSNMELLNMCKAQESKPVDLRDMMNKFMMNR